MSNKNMPDSFGSELYGLRNALHSALELAREHPVALTQVVIEGDHRVRTGLGYIINPPEFAQPWNRGRLWLPRIGKRLVKAQSAFQKPW